jgi:SSS family solute:Na+ symporter/sodium/proline symporter
MFYLWVVIGYLLVLFVVGASKVRTIKNQDDFMVAGRKTPTSLLVGTLICTWIGSGSLFGGAGLAFRMGFSELWMSAGAWVGIVIVYFLAGRVRRIAQYTVSDILEQRYNQWARLFGTSAVIIAYLTIAGYQFRGGGRLLNIIAGIDPVTGAAIACAVTIIFTLLAGMVSIIQVDLFNGIIMLLGVMVGVPLALSAVGGWGHVNTLPADHFAVFGSNDAIWALGVFFPTFFLLLGESSMYQKFFAAENERAARRAVIGMVIGVVIIETLLAALAVIGSSKYISDPRFLNADGSLNKAITETVILQVAFTDLPQWAGGLMMAAAVAIILSTANTFLMIPSTNVTRDIYQRFINPQASQAFIVRFQRILIAVLGVLAFVLANFFKSILDMAFTAYTMVGAGLTPALLAAFLWKRTSIAGGVSSIVAGMAVTLVITIANLIFPEPLMETDYIILPAAAASIFCLIVVSLLTPAPPESKWKPFWQNT